MAQFNSGYTSSEIMAMQKDAERRVREMQKKANEKVDLTNKSFDFFELPFLKNIDKDRLLLLCLFLLLLKEDTDPLLLLALAYIFF